MTRRKLEVVNGNCYIQVNDDVQCCNEDNTLEEDTNEALSSKHTCLENGSEHEDSESDDDTKVKVTHMAARHSIQVL